MPIEYLAPGVYVEEIEGGVHDIEGVPTSTSGFTGVYAHAITIPVPKPAWTDPHQGDPGITLVDLLAWLGEAVLYRRGGRPDARKVNIVAFVSTGPLDEKRLVVSLENLQRVPCRAGPGSAEGLAVEATGSGQPGLSVGPGLALDDGGNELEPDPRRLPAPSQRTGVRRKKET